MLTRVEGGYSYDDSGLPSINALERFHYTTLAQGFQVSVISQMRVGVG